MMDLEREKGKSSRCLGAAALPWRWSVPCSRCRSSARRAPWGQAEVQGGRRPRPPQPSRGSAIAAPRLEKRRGRAVPAERDGSGAGARPGVRHLLRGVLGCRGRPAAAAVPSLAVPALPPQARVPRRHRGLRQLPLLQDGDAAARAGPGRHSRAGGAAAGERRRCPPGARPGLVALGGRAVLVPRPRVRREQLGVPLRPPPRLRGPSRLRAGVAGPGAAAGHAAPAGLHGEPAPRLRRRHPRAHRLHLLPARLPQVGPHGGAGLPARWMEPVMGQGLLGPRPGLSTRLDPALGPAGRSAAPHESPRPSDSLKINLLQRFPAAGSGCAHAPSRRPRARSAGGAVWGRGGRRAEGPEGPAALPGAEAVPRRLQGLCRQERTGSGARTARRQPGTGSRMRQPGTDGLGPSETADIKASHGSSTASAAFL